MDRFADLLPSLTGFTAEIDPIGTVFDKRFCKNDQIRQLKSRCVIDFGDDFDGVIAVVLTFETLLTKHRRKIANIFRPAFDGCLRLDGSSYLLKSGG